MNELARLLLAVIPVIVGLLIALAAMAFLASLGPALIPAAILMAAVLLGWMYFGRKR